MAQLVVRNLEDDVKERLRARARKHGRSMEAEVRAILRAAVPDPLEDSTVGLGTRIASRFKGIGIDLDPFIEELRKEPAEPADFDS